MTILPTQIIGNLASLSLLIMFLIFVPSRNIKENGYKENLRDWFKLIYKVIFGDENGPRMGFFISFFGVEETKQLIKDKLNWCFLN